MLARFSSANVTSHTYFIVMRNKGFWYALMGYSAVFSAILSGKKPPICSFGLMHQSPEPPDVHQCQYRGFVARVWGYMGKGDDVMLVCWLAPVW